MARPHPSLIDLAAGRRVRAVDDPAAVVRSAREHRVGGLLWSRVQAGEVQLDPASRTWLTADDLVTRGWQRQLWGVLDQVVEKLGPIGIEVATFKGVTAQARWYDRDGERPCLDVDLLIPPDQETRVHEVVGALQPRHRWIGDLQSLVAQGSLQSIPLSVKQVPVDLHLDAFKLGIGSRLRATIWERTVPFTLPGGGVTRVLDPEVALLHLLIHLNKDRFRYLLGFTDVAQLMAREHIDWSEFDRLARKEGLSVPAWESLHVVCETLGLRAPRRRTRGWAAVGWRGLWPSSVRLCGDLGVHRYRYRQALLPLFTGRVRETVRWWAAKPFPSRVLVSFYYPEARGRSLGEVTLIRVRRAVERRRQASGRGLDPSPHGTGNGQIVEREALAAPTALTPPQATAALLRSRAWSHPTWITASGSSMGATILPSSRVRVAPAERPRWGEIWAFCDRSGNLLVHRNRGRSSAGWLFQGDASVSPDLAVPDDLLVGRVAMIEHMGRSRSVGPTERWAGGLRLLAQRATRRAKRVLKGRGRG